MPDQEPIQGAAPATSPAQAPEPQPAAPQSPQQSASLPTDPGSGAVASGVSESAPAQAQVSAPSWLDQLRAQGVDVPQDERAAMQALAQQYRDLQTLKPLSPYVSSYLSEAQQYNAWKQQQQAAAQARQAEDKPWYAQFWNPPEYDPQWRNLVRQDEQGNWLPVPGAPPDVVPKFLAAQQFRTREAEKFLSNPHTYIEEPVKLLARQIAEETVQKHLAGYKETISANQFTQEHAPWLYEHDERGGIRQSQVFDPGSGRYVSQNVLSQYGQQFRDFAAQEAERQRSRGYTDIEEQKTNALTRVQLNYALAQLAQLQAGGAPAPAQTAPAQAPATSARQAANQAFLQKNNAPAARSAGGNSAIAPTPVTRQNLQQELRNRFKANGISDEALFTK